ncbi:MAG: methionyl-tRNA formyltransferase [Lentisphaerae bacterium]|nr:methionyl-tRNA formyltransferase [Lentisphaerota bacterium]
MRAVFMGSAPLSCASLEVVLDLCDVVGVVAQPDRPRGRKLKVCHGAVKALALSRDVPVVTPEHINEAESVAVLAAWRPDVIVVVAYGQILRQPLLDIPPLGCINVHTSLLPAYRGAAPIQWAVANGDTETGVTTMFMDTGMDSGDIIYQDRVAIGSDETGAALHDRLALRGAALLRRTLTDLTEGVVPRRPQDVKTATTARRLQRADGRIDWSQSAQRIHNRIRGFNPWPGSFCHAPNGRLLKVWQAELAPNPTEAHPGTVIGFTDGSPVVASSDGAVRLLEVQPEGAKVMGGAAYVRGHALREGDLLE